MFTPPTDPAQLCPAASSQSEAAPADSTDTHGAGRLPPAPPPGGDEPGDVLYGAKAIARFLFGRDGRREQRRVFNL